MLTHQRLLEVLRYEPTEGRFYWLKKGRGVRSSRNYQAGSFDAHGYGQINIDGKVLKEHRLVWFYVHGEWPPGQIDHINHERRDNRIDNLRLVDNCENHKNRPMQKNNTTGHVGVSIHRGAFVAKITVLGKQIHLGRFKLLCDAVAARGRANSEYGFHGNHGDGFGQGRVKPLPKDSLKSNAFVIELEGQSMPATEWAKQDGVTASAGMIRSRIKNGWPAKKAIFTPFVTGKQRSDKRDRLMDGTYAPKAA